MTRDRILVWAGGVAAPIAGVCSVGIAVDGDFPSVAFWFLPWAVAYACGVLAVRRLPAHEGARRLLLFGALSTVWNASSLLLCITVGAVEPRAWLAIPDTLVIALDFAMPAALVALLASYPDGRYQRSYERRVVRAVTALAVIVPPLLLVSLADLAPALTIQWLGETTGLLEVASPVHVEALAFLGEPLAGIHEGALGLIPAVGLLLMALRVRHATAAQRRGMLWPLAGVGALALLPITDGLVELGVLPHAVANVVELGVLLAIPVSVAVGILRPELFDLPRAMRRSVLYGALWAAIAAAYVALAAALGIAAGSERVQLAVLVTIAATLLFQPAWRRVRRRVEERVFGARPSPDELLRRFGAALEHTLDVGELAPTLAEAIREGLGVRWVRLSAGDDVATAGVPAGEPAASVPLSAGDAPAGTIDCGGRVHGRFSAADRELLRTLGHQAALALQNARLAAEVRERLGEIRRQADELAASRTRIVAAEEAGRRRIERDVHDGVQQELVALIARIGLARNQLARDPTLVTSTLADLQLEARQALDDLRELVGGIHPSVLSDYGIVGAIETRAARLPLGVTIECDRAMRGTRFPELVEGAVYFLVSEAFANALKHSGAERVVVVLEQDGGELTVEVRDDGRGFEPGLATGSGLSGLADRIAALGGRFAVDAAPGEGTRLTARLPVAEAARA